MKVRASVRRICENCKIVRRKGVVRVICKTPSTSKNRVNQGCDKKLCRVFRASIFQPDKPIWISLTYLYGVGRTNSRVILRECGIELQRRAKELTEESWPRSSASSTAIPGRRRPAPGDHTEHRPSARHRQLSRQSPSPLPARPRPAHASNARTRKGPQDGRRQEGREGTRQVSNRGKLRRIECNRMICTAAVRGREAAKPQMQQQESQQRRKAAARRRFAKASRAGSPTSRRRSTTPS